VDRGIRIEQTKGVKTGKTEGQDQVVDRGDQDRLVLLTEGSGPASRHRDQVVDSDQGRGVDRRVRNG